MNSIAMNKIGFTAVSLFEVPTPWLLSQKVNCHTLLVHGMEKGFKQKQVPLGIKSKK